MFYNYTTIEPFEITASAYISPEITMHYSNTSMSAYDLLQSLCKNDRKESEHMTKPMHLPMPVRIDRYETATVVHWNDDSFTAVNCGKDDNNNVYAAFAAALAKKLYGSTSMVHKIVDRNLGTVLDAKAQAEKKAREEKRLEAEKRNHDKRIRAMVKEMREKEEASSIYCRDFAKNIGETLKKMIK